MKKCSLFILIILSSFFLFSCSKDNNKMPDDLIVVLPDGKEIYLYMPREDLEAILGKGEKESKSYYYSELDLNIYYYEDLVCLIKLNTNSNCKTKNGLNPSSRKKDFLNANYYSQSEHPEKVYLLDENENFITSSESDPYPDIDTKFHKAAGVLSFDLYSSESDPNSKYVLMLHDWWCSYFGIYDNK